LIGLQLFAGGALAVATALPLAWKWQLGVARSAVAVAVLAAIAALAVVLAADVLALDGITIVIAEWLLTLALAGAVVLFRFYRDPDRTPPADGRVVVSPADGEVLYVRSSERGRLPVTTKGGRSYRLEELVRTPRPDEDAVVVGIGLSFLDVHVNRSPIEGRVAAVDRHPGRFGSLRLPEMVFENERATLVIQGRELDVAVVLIASRLVRQIVTWVRAGQDVVMGERVGVIRFGSQVDLVLPARPDLGITVRPGDRVRAGESVVAVLGAGERLEPEPLSSRRASLGSTGSSGRAAARDPTG
jgi:phosphatidylserine decarboxylase